MDAILVVGAARSDVGDLFNNPIFIFWNLKELGEIENRQRVAIPQAVFRIIISEHVKVNVRNIIKTEAVRKGLGNMVSCENYNSLLAVLNLFAKRHSQSAGVLSPSITLADEPIVNKNGFLPAQSLAADPDVTIDGPTQPVIDIVSNETVVSETLQQRLTGSASSVQPKDNPKKVTLKSFVNEYIKTNDIQLTRKLPKGFCERLFVVAQKSGYDTTLKTIHNTIYYLRISKNQQISKASSDNNAVAGPESTIEEVISENYDMESNFESEAFRLRTKPEIKKHDPMLSELMRKMRTAEDNAAMPESYHDPLQLFGIGDQPAGVKIIIDLLTALIASVHFLVSASDKHSETKKLLATHLHRYAKVLKSLAVRLENNC